MAANKQGRPALQARLWDWFLCLPEVLPWYEGIVFTGLSIKMLPNVVRLVVRGTKQGSPVVCFVHGQDLEEAFLNLAALVKSPTNAWKPDKFAKNGD